jgi:hypothetical protein
MTAYLDRKLATCKPKTVSCLATRLTHFGLFLTRADPGLVSLAALDRQRHIEPYPSAQVDAPNSKNDAVITIGERQRRILAVGNFLTDMVEDLEFEPGVAAVAHWSCAASQRPGRPPAVWPGATSHLSSPRSIQRGLPQ